MSDWMRADRQAQAHVERAHPFHVAAGQIVVDRDDMDALAVQRIEIGRQRGDQRLAFAGDHFGDVAGMQHHAAHQLDVVMPHAQEAAARFAADGEGLDQQIVERFTLGQPAAEFAVCSRSSSSLIAWYFGSRALMALTLGCSFLMYRAFDEPNSEVMPRSIDAQSRRRSRR